MAPQPIFRVKRDCSLTFGDPKALTHDPALGAAYAAAIATWAYAESYYGTILVQLLGGVAEPALAMMQALTSTSAQDQALEAAASAVLKDDVLDVFLAAMAISRKQRRRRNFLAHGVVGQARDMPSAIVVAAAKDMQTFWLDMFVKKRFTDIEPKQFSTEAFNKFLKTAYVYRQSDLDDLTKQFDRVADILVEVAVLVTPVHHRKANALRTLLAMDEIQAQLAKQRKGATDSEAA